jgi:2,5-dioxopentanoate dehydrogenase
MTGDSMSIAGHSIIAGEPTPGTDGSLRAFDARTGEELEPEFTLAGPAEVERATRAAVEAFDAYRATTPAQRAAFLEAIATHIEADAERIVARAVAESGLPEGRLSGELGRTTGQLRMFASVVRSGDHLEARIDPARPDRTPLPRPDIRQRHIAVGPVVVFGASNFPLAFSTAGGDTASALAAGCPVIVKAHNAHPGTTALVAAAVTRAVTDSQLPSGVFSVLFGAGTDIGQALVADPRVKAVGFTGSRAGGLALVRTANARREPIPVYAEMSSVNPVFVLPSAVAQDATGLATAYVGSLTLGSGQFCTNPGLVFVPEGPDGDTFVKAAADAVATAQGQTMLTDGIASAYAEGTSALRAATGVRVLAEGEEGEARNAPAPLLAATTAATYATTESLQNEVFGAASLVVRYSGIDDLAAAAEGLEGQLTVTIQYADGDEPEARVLFPVLERKAGRILFNGWPTGVEVGHAMVHGGPFPATSDPRTTSVGSLAIYRFQRPVAYQDVPAALLPEPVREDNPWRLNRRVDGVLLPAGEGTA